MLSRARHAVTALLLLAGLSLSARTARADALVVVRVQGQGAPEGRVTLAARGGATFSCQTSGHTCRIDGVPGGSYRVEFHPVSGPAPAPRTAMIPPSGTVTLVVSGT